MNNENIPNFGVFFKKKFLIKPKFVNKSKKFGGRGRRTPASQSVHPCLKSKLPVQ